MIAIDGYELGMNVIKNKNIQKSSMIDKSLENMEKSYREVYSITRIVDLNGIVNKFPICINHLDSILSEYNNICILVQHVNVLNADLSKGIEKVPLRIRSFNEEISEDSINCLIIPIRKIYDELGYIFNINTSEEPIDIVRIESGTFETMFNGNTVLCTIIGFLLPKL